MRRTAALAVLSGRATATPGPAPDDGAAHACAIGSPLVGR